MGKTKDNNKPTNAKKAKATIAKKKSGGLDEIDSLFAQKKQSDKEIQQQIEEEKELVKQERKRRKQARLEEEADEMALRGSSSAAAAAAGGGIASAKKGDAVAPAALHEKAKKLSALTYTRSDMEALNDDSKKEAKNKWATDGLGGVFNGEGFTGRRDDGGHRVFKAHLMNKKGFGEGPDCPFDCDCCFI